MINFDIDEIRAAMEKKGCGDYCVVAIDGGSGSGKSTLAAEWKAHYPSARVITLDDMHIPAGDAELDCRSPEDNFNSAFDLEHITENILKPLASGKPAVYKVLNPESADAGKEMTVEPAGIIIIEGVYSLRPAWRGFYGFKIWLEAGAKHRLEIMKKREANTESQMRCWQRTEEWYIRTTDPASAADMVITINKGGNK